MSERITIGINTYNRPEYLAVTLSSLLAQTFQDWDLILADNSDEPVLNREYVHRLIGVIKRYGHRFIILQEPGGGIPQTYQAMMEASPTDLCVRQEDDVWFEPGMLQNLHDAIMSDENIAAVAPMTPNWKHSLTIAPPDKLKNGFVRTRSGLVPELQTILEAVDQQQVVMVAEPGQTYDVCTIHGGSLYRKSLMTAAGGWAKNYSPVGHREETIAYARAYLKGYRLVVAASARLWHFEASLGGSRPAGQNDPNRNAQRSSDEAMFQRELTSLIEKHPDRPIDVFDSAPANT